VAKVFAYAVESYTRATEDGDSEAIGYFGACYENGEGVTVDDAKVFEWYMRRSDA
jgi:TPR repeat protein